MFFSYSSLQNANNHNKKMVNMTHMGHDRSNLFFSDRIQLKLLKKMILIGGICLLTACAKKIELQTQIPENDANEIVAVLLKDGVSAEKITGKNGANVLVPDSQVGQAMETLAANGLPRKQNMGLGEIFKKEGMISTPLEERARYIFGLSQELERTLGEMDHVVNARVHVVLPERVAPGEPITPSSASVFIKHRKGFDADLLLPSIRKLVSTSIPGLSAVDKEKISVVFSLAQENKEHISWTNFGPVQVQTDSISTVQTTFFLMLFFNILTLVALVLTFLYPEKIKQFFKFKQKNNPYQEEQS
jgi:type III secretion protein J